MKKLGKILLALIAVFVVLEIVLVIVLALKNRVPHDTVLVIRVPGNLPEQAPGDEFTQLFFGRPTTLTDVVEGLELARTDPRISGLELRVGASAANMAKIQEIREAVREFNRAGKFSVAYLEFGSNRTYYLASACQTVVLMPKSVLYVRGFMASSTFFRGTLDKLGVVPDFLEIGPYKNAPNLYTEKKYTAAHREATQALLDDWSGQFIQGVADSRKLPVEQVKQDLARGPFTSQDALGAHWVDRLGYRDEVTELVRQKNHGSDRRLNLDAYLDRAEREGKSAIAVIYAVGDIVPGRSGRDAFGGAWMGSDTVGEQFKRAREDRDIRAVILRVNSPGGVAMSSEAIRRELLLTRQAKPVVVSMSDLAASGGYWISMGASKIVADPGTITGSIGVFSGKFNISGLYAKLGLSQDSITTTENSTLDWPFQNFTPAQRQLVMRQMQDIYANFLQGVSEGRHMPVAAVDKIAQGRVWTGERALKLGLVDQLGGLETAVGVAKQLAGIPAQEQVRIIFLPRPKSIFERLREVTSSASVWNPLSSIREDLARIEELARLPVWAILPEVPEVQ